MRKNYTPTLVQNAKKHTRYNLAQLFHSDAPLMNYREETVIVDGDDIIVTNSGEISQVIDADNNGTVFKLVSVEPEQIVDTGKTMTYGELLHAIDSFYHHIAGLRDQPKDPPRRDITNH